MNVSSGWPHPIVVALDEVPVTVVGGGPVAERKIETLLEGGARVTVVTPEATPAIEAWAGEGRLTLKRRPYRAGDLYGARLAYAATSRSEVNRAVRIEAMAEGVWLNVVDQPNLSDFISPAVVRRGDLTIAISTNGRAPALAKQIREDLERQFSPEFANRVNEAAASRPKGHRSSSCSPGRSPAPHLSEAGALPGGGSPAPHLSEAGAVRVALVGAGPGDPELITLKGRRLLQAADTVVYDALVSSRLLDFCAPAAELIFVGKRDSRHTLPQAEINELLISKAREGKRVVRLKGGDPFVFGRGGEEVEALAEAGLDYEVVPGVSAGVAVPAYAGIPLTHRDFTSELVFLTGHECVTSREPVDWSRYARTSASLVIFMGVHNLPTIARLLLEHGRDPGCPVAVIENGTADTQRTIVAPLVRIADVAHEAGIFPPALIVVGDVVRMREKLAWFGEGARHRSAHAESLENATAQPERG